MQNSNSSRFAALFSTVPERAIWDNVVLRLGRFAVSPSRGSIIPMWLLIVPEDEAINFAELESDVSHYALISRVAEELSPARTDLIWFEHGANVRGSTVGCGVDHAHLHVILSPKFSIDEFAAAALEASGRDWMRVTAASAYDVLGSQESYYAFGNLETAFVVRGANFGSQFFRKLVAALVNRPDEWDYNIYGGEDMVEATLTTISGNAVAA
jgi:ATP adenylyltransferase